MEAEDKRVIRELLRDVFALSALRTVTEHALQRGEAIKAEEIARDAYELADAMMAQRARETA